MRKKRRSRTFALLIVSILILPQGIPAQLISIKSVPLATGDQFTITPSQTRAMGGLFVAVKDRLGDPFANPAKGSEIRAPFLFSSPAVYHITKSSSSARTLPVGGYYSSGKWFGGALLSAQQLNSAKEDNPFLLGQNSSSNIYFQSFLGKRLSEKLSVGGSFFGADLGAVEGVELLYPGSRRVEQYGKLLDLRAGLQAKFKNGAEAEALLLFNHLKMNHLVENEVWNWENGDFISGQEFLTKKNLDETNTWGLHFGYREPVGNNGWNAGTILTLNYKSHPKIPNYELMNIPRDPGNSWAYNFGVGISKETDLSTFGMELIYEPIWSETWADAAQPVETITGKIIPLGGKTLENSFAFSNYQFGIGFSRQNENVRLYLGLRLYSIRYRLTQKNNIQEFSRRQTEHWEEWSPSWGISFGLSDLRIYYFGKFTSGTGLPGLAVNTWDGGLESAAKSDFIIAPEGALALEKWLVLTNQIVVEIPL